ncbi:GNAT family N-acetyltransferase [Polyangium sorediatum]|uniref:GNAT family N-acetyltransferase n=1 Tax=Polyangium sorediatum TaxID=889274 RepID=A0ABT6P6Y5_9BACT|nr:GNAT family N-acetyltransferase [Polyangium sorediatum]MDI1436328.1 GNAT family N-acetyltransferase [Polyangium sorediatum]
MLDTYVLPVSPDEPTTVAESLALLEHELDEVPDAVFPGLSGQPPELDPWEVINILEGEMYAGRLKGFAGYVGGFPAALCLVGALAAFGPNASATAGRVATVACLLVAPRYQRLGLGRVLLAEAENALRAEGVTFVDAYPPKARPEKEAGPLATFLQAGFVQVGEAGDRVLVRKTLGTTRARKVG